MKIREFIIPNSLAEAQQMLSDASRNTIAAAGCTAFHFLTGDEEKTAVLLTRSDLAGISAVDASFKIGALTTINSLIDFKAPGWVLDIPSKQLASHQIRNISTLGGNIARIFPWSDFPVILLALNAKMTIASASEERTYAADDYFAAQPAKLFKAEDVLTSVSVPALSASQGFGHCKQRMKSESFSLGTASAVVTVENNKITAARVALGAAVAFPTLLTAVNDALVGMDVQNIDAIRSAVIEAVPAMTFLTKEGMKPDYIERLARVSAADAVCNAIAQREQGAE